MLQEPLNYRRPDKVAPEPHPESTWRRFVAGLAIGTGVSAVLWVGGPAVSGFVPANVVFGLASVVVPGTKLVLGLSLLSQPPWKSFGAGLLTSLPAGLLIMCGVCGVAMTRR